MQVTTSGLGHSFPGTGMLFTGLDFTARPGDLVAVTGPSGSGKSTLLSLLAGWEKPTEGTVHREGIEDIGWVFQNPHGTARRSALDHVALPLLAKGLTRREATEQAHQLMATFGLGATAQRQFRMLSGGEAQRLMLARAVAKRPDLLLVDEPTAQLDPHATVAVNTVLGELAARDMIVVVATHDPDTAAACSSRLELGNHAAG